MSRVEKQKAIDALKISAPIHALTEEKFNDYIQTLNKIMDWLEEEPCVDAIDRRAVLEYIEGSEAELGHSSENELVCQDIKGLPPVTPQPKTGYWIEEITGYSRKVYCSKCKTPAIFECISMGDIYSGGSMHGEVKKTKFCPECGVKMKTQESEEEV